MSLGLLVLLGIVLGLIALAAFLAAFAGMNGGDQ